MSARLQLHHAAQLVVASAISYLPPQPDDSHTNLEWLPEHKALAGRVISASSGVRFGLRLADLTILLLGRGGEIIDAVALIGRGIAAGDRWMREALGQSGLDPSRLTQTKHYAIPAHPVAEGAAFDAPLAQLTELASYYHDAWILTTRIAAEHAGASESRCWPHHFDLATLLTVPDASGGTRRTIGVGMSPGDVYYAEPYVYIGPYPYPPAERLGALPSGRWHTHEWTGAVLTATEFTGQRGGERVLEFARAAVAACEQAFAASTPTA